MHIASAISSLQSPPAIAQDIEGQIKSTLPTAPDLLLVFVSFPLLASFEPIVSMLKDALEPEHLLAVIGESVLGTDQEIEGQPAVSALAIHAPGATLHSFYLDPEHWQDLLTDEDYLTDQLAPRGTDENVRAFFMFGDPFTTPIVQFLEVCSHRFPGAPVLGGMASGMHKQGETRLAHDDRIYTNGLVGVSFAGNVEIDCVISQGCKPVGEPFVITAAKQNVIEQLNGKPALAAIEEMVQALPIPDRQLLVVGGLLVGRVIDEGKGNFGPGDFLIRPLVGARRDTGAVLIGDHVRVGQTVQFHVRDAKTADREMRLLLEGETMLAPASAQPAGAMLISCNARGTRLFDMPHHDISLTRQILGTIPIAGFFAAGELGPVGEKNFIHGHTAALALFRETAT